MAVDLEVGMLLGRYRLVELLARGGMGTVWVAHDEQLERDVALKVLPGLLVSDEAARRRFEREARALGRLLHPNVVTIFDVGSADPGSGRQLPFLVMELLRGHSLAEEMTAGPLPPDRAVSLMEQVARALGAAHAAGIVHRDLKPSNVMVGDNDHVSVLDFGLARLLHRDSGLPEDSLTTPGMVLGSCSYMSPEQALGHKVGPASDIFSCGAVLYEALSGRRAFDGANPVRVLQEVVRARHEPLGPGVGDELSAVVERCLAREPETRYEDGAALARDLAAVRSHTLSGARLQPSEVSDRARARAGRRPPALASAAAGVALAALAVAGGVVVGRGGREALRPNPGAWGVRSILQVDGALGRPSWSPSGGQLAVDHRSQRGSEILVVTQDGARVQSRATGVGLEVLSRPRFSPDGTLLLVGSRSDEGARLRVLPALGGAPLAEVVDAERGAWLTQGTIVFRRTRSPSGELWTFDLESSQVAPLLTRDEGRMWWDQEPRPGGGLIALEGPDDGAVGLWLLPEDGGRPRPWPAPPGPWEGVSWAGGGRSLAVAAGGGLVKVSAGGFEGVVPPLADLLCPSFSPDGRRLAAIRSQRGFELVELDPSTGKVRRVTASAGPVGPLAVGGDGVCVYGREPGSWGDLQLRRADGEGRALLVAGEVGSWPSVAPEGDRVAVLCRAPGGAVELRVCGPADGQTRVVAEGVHGGQAPAWSPDGRHLAYSAGRLASVWVVSTLGGPPRLLTAAGGESPVWSPDGGWIAYLLRPGGASPENVGVWIVPSSGGRPRRVGDVVAPLAWSPSGRLWQLRRERSALELWEATPDTWSWRRRSTLEGELAGAGAPTAFAVDGSSGGLLLHRARASAELLVLDGIDPDRW